MSKIYTDLNLMVQDMIDWKCYIVRADEPSKMLIGFTSFCNSWLIKLIYIKSLETFEFKNINSILKVVNKNKEPPDYNEIGMNLKCNLCLIKNIIE